MHLDFDFDVVTLIGYLGAAFYSGSAFVKRMIPLRRLAVASNACFIVYLAFSGHWASPEFALNVILLPINAIRLREIHKLTAEIQRASQDTPVSEWLLPHMTRRTFKAGEVLFRRGDHADIIIYLASGKVKIQELGQMIEPGTLIGEIGLFSPDRLRTQTIVCESDGEAYTMTDEKAYQLYYQNPRLGFYFMRLVAERLLRDARRTAEAPPPQLPPLGVAPAA
jgi:hypothetical protein